MRLKLTLARPTGSATDIAVTADAGATVGAVAARIAKLDPQNAGQQFSTEGLTLGVQHPQQTVAAALDPDTQLSDAKIGSGAVVQVIDSRQHGRGAESVPLAILRVVAGADTGREFQLSRGSVVLGRDPGCDLVLNDPMVSKRHVRVELTDTLDVVDLNSANAIVVDGDVVTRARLQTGQTITLGDTILRAEFIARPIAPAVEVRFGPVSFNRSPLVEPRYPGEEFDGPDVPKEVDPIPFPWAAFAAPLILVTVMFFILPEDRRMMLIFLGLSPVLMVGAYVTQKIAQRSKLKRLIAKFEKQLTRLGETLGTERVREREVRNAEAPPTEYLVDQALLLGPTLWVKRPEHWSFLNVRLGTGTVPSRNSVKLSNRFDGIPEFQERLETLVEEYKEIPDVAIVENLVDAGCLGVAGDPRPATDTANALLAQIASLYSPAEVAMAAIVSPQRSPEFDWIKWLPHAGSAQSVISTIHLADSAVSAVTVLSALEELIDKRSKVRKRGSKSSSLGPVELEKSVMGAAPSFVAGEGPFRPEAPCLIVLICDDAPVDRARLNAVVERAVRAGILPIWLADNVSDLPAACRTFIGVSPQEGAGATVGYVRTGLTIENVAVSKMHRGQVEHFAKILSSVSDSSALSVDESDIPRSVSMLSLLGPEMAVSSEAVIDRWRQNDSIHDRTPGAKTKSKRAGRLRALVGQSSVDAMHLDLRAQGPHALVGGTTGSGKSEFLQAWVLGMAAEYSPDRVTFLFVDYKGGSAFAECVKLPHCVGLVTDLTPHLVRRALTSLRAELHFREHLLNRKKAKDLIELEKRGDPEAPPALVLVIDEFAALVGEVPEFVDGIVDIAQRGRSLGIHLIMATQRPAGVIRDNLRANTNLRIALRVADVSDSVDVLGSGVAAGFDPAIPGRAIAKSGPGRLTGFQTGYAGGWTTDKPVVPSIEVTELAFGNPVVWTSPEDIEEEPEIADLGPNDTSRLVSTMTSAALVASIPEPRKPWLDELGAVYDAALLRQRTDTELLIGVVDDAKHQSQYPVYFQPDLDGHMAVYGAGGTGKSVALRTLAIAAAITPRGGPVQVYALDFGSAGMRLLEALPHVGAVIDGDDTERVTRLFGRLSAIVEERAERYAAVRAGNIGEYRTLSGQHSEPRILVLIDGGGPFRQQYEFLTDGVYAAFLQLLADGRTVGVHIVMTADRPGAIHSAVASSLQRKLVLRLTDEADYQTLDLPQDILSSRSAPGRAIFEGMEAQVAVFGGSTNIAEQSRAIERLALTLAERGVPAAPGVERLAEDIPLASLVAPIPGQPVLGVSDEELTAISFEAQGTFMLTGPPASGRTTALHTLAQSVVDAVPGVRTFYFGNAKSALKDLPLWEASASSIENVVSLAKEVTEAITESVGSGQHFAIFVEGLADFLSTPADQALIELFKAAKRADHFVLAESETSTWSSSWPLLQELKSGRRGFALQPDMQEGDLLFRTSFPRSKRSQFPPGRGYFVQAGKTRRVQLARVQGEGG